MKKTILFVLVGVLLLSACNAVQVKEPTAAAPATGTPAVIATLAPTVVPIVATATVIPTSAPTATLPKVLPTGVYSGSTEGGWAFTWFAAADKNRDNGTTFRQDVDKWFLRTVAPELWPVFPNVPNPLVPDFRVVNGNEVPDGLEYANAESNFCQQLAGEACRVPVAARHYFYFTGDYNVPNIGSCKEGDTGYGCMLVIVNIGDVTSDFTGVFNQGFRLHARYWNGDALDVAIWALVSSGDNVMMNLNSKLNPNGFANAGANCSIPTGCQGVKTRVLFVSGNEPLLMLETEVSRH